MLKSDKGKRFHGFISLTCASLAQQFSVDLYFQIDGVNSAASSDSSDTRTRFLGLWFGIFPLKLSDLSKNVMCTTSVTATVNTMCGNTACTREARMGLDRQLECMVQEYRKSHEAEQAKLKLLCSSGNPVGGHICDSDTSLVGIFKRLFSQKLVDFRRGEVNMAGVAKLFNGEEHEMAKGTLTASEIVLGYKQAFFFHSFLQSRLERYEPWPGLEQSC